jgi:hypothetical protein
VITRADHEPVVIMSLADFESLRKAAYLMRSPTNARRLLDAMERLGAGRGEQPTLVDADGAEVERILRSPAIAAARPARRPEPSSAQAAITAAA